MKIAFINVNYKNSSTGNITFLLHEYFKNLENFESRVFYGKRKKYLENGVFKFGLDIETYFHALMARLTGLNGFFSFFSTARLIYQLKKYKPDIIHIHELHAYYLNIYTLLNFISKNNIKTIFTLHSEYIFTGKCGNTNGCNKFTTLCFKCPQVKNYPKSYFFDFSTFMFNYKKKYLNSIKFKQFISPSLWLKSQFDKSFLNYSKISVIRNSINHQIFHNNYIFHERRLNFINTNNYSINDKFVLVVIPKLESYQKGFDKVIKIAEYINSIGHLNIKILVVGQYSNINKYINLPKNIHLLGKISDKNVLANLYQISSLFLITSRLENYPTTVIESGSCGTPIIGFYSGGTGESIPKEYKFLFLMDRIEELSNTLINNIDFKNQTVIQTLGNYVKDETNINVFLDKHKDLYLKAFNEKN